MTRRASRGAVPAVVLVLAGLLGAVLFAACGGSTDAADTSPSPVATQSSSAAKVTFIELGSVDCVPCKEMQPVMDAIAETFGDQVEIVFYDVWEDPAPANEYGVQMIPTQVFLDENGDEFHRHVGFYPEAEIEALLVEHGLEKPATP